MATIQKAFTNVAIVTAALLASSAIADVPGAMPGDNAMTCEQIGTELAPYAQQMGGAFTPLAKTGEQVMARGQARMTEYAPTSAAVSAGAMASSLDPTGMASKAYGQAEVAMQKQIWDRTLAEDKPLNDQYNRQANAALAQAQAMQSNARIQRLMQLAQQKNCH
jgi:hypothetical protein